MSMPAMTAPRQEARPTGGCSCDPPWPLLYTDHGTRRKGTWRQVFPAPAGHTAPAWCVGCGATYTGPWLPHPP